MEQLKINDTVQVIIPPGSLYSGQYKSRIEDITKDTVSIGIPLKDGSIIPLHVGETVLYCKTTENGVFVYQSKIISRQAGPLPVLVMTKPHKTDKVQRRNFYRFSIFLGTQYTKLLPDVPMSDLVWHEGKLKNMSGGGICLVVSEEGMVAGDQLFVDLPLDQDIIRTKVEIRRVSTEGQYKDRVYVLGCQFQNLPRGHQERIIQFIFTKQRAAASR